MKDGATVGSLALSDSAPLVFRALDRAALADTPLSTEKQSKLKSPRKCLADYMAKYVAMNSTLKARDESREAVFLSPGGSQPPVQQRRPYYVPQRRDDRHRRPHLEEGQPRRSAGGAQAAREGWVLNEEKKHLAAWQLESDRGRMLMGQDVFYMMICNMLSDEDMVAVWEHIKDWWLLDSSKATEGMS